MVIALKPYAGTYILDEESHFEVQVLGLGLEIRAIGEGATELLGSVSGRRPSTPTDRIMVFPISPTEFRTYSMRTGLGPRVGVEFDDNGHSTAIEFESDIGTIPAYRK